ncbi:lipoate--protein ligase family protein [Candidatus Woesearchaeota archaeon]|nr:lipoate--protein ligase family protein [Candidatus Woesearchaeota archaeon]
MQWRFIGEDTYDAAMNMAIDEAICNSVEHNNSLPTIRFYKWKNNSVSIGSNQNQDEINLNLCKKSNVVRRITGGRAVFHDKRDFTYSVIVPIKIFGNSIKNAYSVICSWVIGALRDLGIKSELENKNDIMAGGKKISGNAAKLFDNGIYLQHGTLVYDVDIDLMPEILNIGKKTAKENIASITQFKNISQKKAYEALKDNFIKDKNIKIQKLSKEELNYAKELAETKYNSIKLPKNALMKNKGACYVLSGN